MKKKLPILLAMALCWCSGSVMAQTTSYKQVWNADKEPPAMGIIPVGNVPTEGTTVVHYAIDGRKVNATESGIHVVQDGNTAHKVLIQ